MVEINFLIELGREVSICFNVLLDQKCCSSKSLISFLTVFVFFWHVQIYLRYIILLDRKCCSFKIIGFLTVFFFLGMSKPILNTLYYNPLLRHGSSNGIFQYKKCNTYIDVCVQIWESISPKFGIRPPTSCPSQILWKPCVLDF